MTSLQFMSCSREQAEQLRDLGLSQPIEYYDWQPGNIYSAIIREQEKIFVIGNDEDPPHRMYKPIRLYDLTELVLVTSLIEKTIQFKRLKDGMWIQRDFQVAFDSPAQAAANTLIFLLSNHPIDSQSINIFLSQYK